MTSRDIVAFLADGDVLLDSGRLPVLTAPELQRDLLDRAGAEVFTGPVRRVAVDVFVRTVAARTQDRPPGEWVPVQELTDAQSFSGELGPAVRQAVMGAEREYSGAAPVPPQRPEWYAPGWLDEVDRWVDAALAAAGRRRTGPSVVLRMWSLSAIVRVATDSGAVFFKSTGGGFDAEPAVTALLAQRYGPLMPAVLATATGGRPRRAWMLLEELSGVDRQRAPGAALALAPVLADLQAGSVGDLARLRAAGCPDRTAASLLDGLAMLLAESVELAGLSADDLDAARAAAPRMAELVRELWDCGLPATLTHGDLHVGNVAYDGDQVRVFDWTDAAVSHPFFDIMLLAGSAEDSAERGRLTLDPSVADAFAARWRAHCPEADIDRALALAAPVNDLYQAISYEGIYRNQEDASRWELEGVVERFLRRLPELVDRVG
jgi:aminoglycoside phosphotransferase (APT) family kinase protein